MNNNFLMDYDKITGKIKGFYLEEVHGDNIPEGCIEITPEKHTFYMENNGRYKLNINTLEDELIVISSADTIYVSIEDRISTLENMLLMQGGII